jgi:DNA polymerase I-like protein with 3'-5' exonuclease and polymerase domains
MARHGCEIKEPRKGTPLDVFTSSSNGYSILQMDYYRAEVQIMAALGQDEKLTNG